MDIKLVTFFGGQDGFEGLLFRDFRRRQIPIRSLVGDVAVVNTNFAASISLRSRSCDALLEISAFEDSIPPLVSLTRFITIPWSSRRKIPQSGL